MRKRYLLLAGLIVLLGAASYAAATLLATREGGRSGPPGLGLLHGYLELTAEQSQAVSEVDARFAEPRLALRQKIWDARQRLLDVLKDPSSTREDALAAVRVLGEAQRHMQMNTIEYAFELRKHLTAQQREKLVGMMGRGMCAAACGQMRGMGGMGRGPHGSGRGRGFQGGLR